MTRENFTELSHATYSHGDYRRRINRDRRGRFVNSTEKVPVARCVGRRR